MNTNTSAQGLLELARTHPNHSMHESTVLGGFPVIMFYVVNIEDGLDSVELYIDDYFVVTKEGQRCEGYLGIDEVEIGRMKDEIFKAHGELTKRARVRAIKRIGAV